MDLNFRQTVLLLIFTCLIIAFIIHLVLQRDTDGEEMQTAADVELMIPAVTTAKSEGESVQASYGLQDDGVDSIAADYINSLVADNDPKSLEYARGVWLREELAAIELLSQENFSETLLNTADWRTNYYQLVTNSEPSPSLWGGTERIIYSRRFIKLVEEIQQSANPSELLDSVRNQIIKDVARYKELKDQGQSLWGSAQIFYSPHFENEDLIVPVHYRIHSAVMVLSQFPSKDNLPSLLDAANGLADDANHVSLAHALHQVFSEAKKDFNSSDINTKMLVEEYLAWSNQTHVTPIGNQSRTIQLPTYRSPARPADRAIVMGATPDFKYPQIELKVPKQYRAYVRADGKGYIDSQSAIATSKRVIEFAQSLDPLNSRLRFIE